MKTKTQYFDKGLALNAKSYIHTQTVSLYDKQRQQQKCMYKILRKSIFVFSTRGGWIFVIFVWLLCECVCFCQCSFFHPVFNIINRKRNGRSHLRRGNVLWAFYTQKEPPIVFSSKQPPTLHPSTYSAVIILYYFVHSHFLFSVPTAKETKTNSSMLCILKW